MRIYVAASYSRIVKARELATQLVDAGHEITSTWLSETHPPNVQLVDLDPCDLAVHATLDLADIDRADAIVLLAEPPTAQPPRGSRHVEFGYAIAKGLQLWVIGDEPENLFHYLPYVHLVETVQEIPSAKR